MQRSNGSGRVGAYKTQKIILSIHVTQIIMVALAGVEDLIVVQTEDATLVCHKDQAQSIKALVQKLGGQPDLKKFT